MNITKYSWKKDIPYLLFGIIALNDLPSIIVGLVLKLFFGMLGMIAGVIAGSCVTGVFCFYIAAKDRATISYKMDEDP